MAVRSVLTRSQILAKVRNLAGDLGSILDDLLILWLHDVHRDIESFYDFEWLEATSTIQLKAGVSRYAMPEGFRKFSDVHGVTLEDGGDIEYISENEFLDKYRSNRFASGTPTNYRQFGPDEYVQFQPRQRSTLKVRSTHGEDNQTVFIKGISGGLVKSEEITLSGKSEVSFENGYDHVQVFSTTNDHLGSVILTTSDGMDLVILPPKVSASSFKPIEFYPKPTDTDDGQLVYINHFIHIPDLIHDMDISVVPDQNTLIWCLLWYVYQHQEDKANADKFLMMFENAKSRLAAESQNKLNMHDQVVVETFAKRRI